MTRPDDDVIELGAVAAVLWQGKWRILAWVVGGAALAGAALLVLPKSWEARATVFARSAEGSPGSLSQSGLSDLVSTAVLGGGGTRMETELELLRSRRLQREVATMLPLAVQVRSPTGVAPTAVIRAFVANGVFAPRTLTVTRSGAAWRLHGDKLDTTLAAGGSITLPEGTLTLRDPPLIGDAGVEIRLLDNQRLEKLLDKRIKVDRAGGDVASVTTRWGDSVTGALVANALVERYVAWRRETDSGDNARLMLLVASQVDSVERALASALNSLRALQERDGVTDPVATAGVLVDRLTRLQVEGRDTRVQQVSLDTIIAELARDRTGGEARRLPTFPAFLMSPAIADLTGQISRLETERTSLLQTRTTEDPAVRGRTASIAQLEAQLLPLAQTYRGTLTERQRELGASTDSVQGLLAALPRAGREYADRVRDVDRLSRMSTALRTQALQLRIAVNNAGGGARQVDVALPTRLPVWPDPLLTMLIGIGVGAATGVARELLRRRAAQHAPHAQVAQGAGAA